MNVAVVIPACNEADTISGVLADLQHELPDAFAVVVDNGSTDGTAGLAAEAGATVLSEPRMGYGSACLRGIAWLATLSSPPEILIILDADGADDLRFLPLFLERIHSGVDLALSTRMRGGAREGSLSGVQIWGNRLQTRVINRRFALDLSDMGPMRAVRFEALLRLGMKDVTWGWNVEMVCKAARQGLVVEEIPVTYGRRKGGKSKISGSLKGVARAGSRILVTLWLYAR